MYTYTLNKLILLETTLLIKKIKDRKYDILVDLSTLFPEFLSQTESSKPEPTRAPLIGGGFLAFLFCFLHYRGSMHQKLTTFKNWDPFIS